jgi:CheY-like chemotaxis protein
VLIVEDDSEIVATLADVLEDEGYEVRCAANGRAALNLLKSLPSPLPCVILLDLMMPVMNGAEFRREQIDDPAFAAIPVVLLTAEPSATRVGRELNVAATLRKPPNLEELLALVRTYC